MYRSDIQAEFSIQLNTCGTEGKNSSAYTMLRPNGRSDYYLLYIHEGYLKIRIDGKMKNIAEGKCVIFTPNVSHEVFYPVNEKQSIYYAHVTGTAISESINMLTQKPISVFPVKSNQLFSLIFMQLIEEFLKSRNFEDDTFKPTSTVKISALIFQILDMLKPEDRDSCDDVIFNSMRYISNHFCEDINLEKCASNCCLSVSRYTHLFKEKIGISPYKLIVRLRIEKAKKLLENTSASVTEISEDVGFLDPAYFSRFFKDKNGLSPSEYRKSLKNKNNS
ncbi:MAG: AraC family transcriptional regulator [Clostridiales bacterium]|nr:AraC family transcriptional regulator [Clostridiales bacterium]